MQLKVTRCTLIIVEEQINTVGLYRAGIKIYLSHQDSMWSRSLLEFKKTLVDMSVFLIKNCHFHQEEITKISQLIN